MNTNKKTCDSLCDLILRLGGSANEPGRIAEAEAQAAEGQRQAQLEDSLFGCPGPGAVLRAWAGRSEAADLQRKLKWALDGLGL